MKLRNKPKSILYTSSMRTNVFPKLYQYGAHAVVLDLEDGVPAADKVEARCNIQAFTSISRQSSGTQWAIRINEVMTSDGLKDLLFLESINTTLPHILIMSMVTTGWEIAYVKKLLVDSSLDPLPKIFVTIECPAAITNVKHIAKHADGLIFGSADYCASIGTKIGGWEKLLYARSSIVNAAMQYDIPAYDTAYFVLNDDAGLLEESEKAKDMGFFGKTAIHPQQINVINKIFTPTEEELQHANEIIRCYEHSEGGILRRDNQMIGPPFYKLAKKTLLKV